VERPQEIGVTIKLAEVLEDQLQALGELQNLLHLETVALAESQDETIIQLAAAKQALLQRLVGCAQSMETLLRQVGVTPDTDGLADYIRETGSSSQLADLYERTASRLDSCRLHNQTNGAIVERRRWAIERALRVFFRDQAATDRYRPTGKLEGFSTYRSIGEA
jgi:flagellar biosynthesis/type III secretory pathway chaperone